MAYDYELEKERDKAGWNLLGAQTQHIFSLVSKATVYYLKGDLSNWFGTLTAMRFNINYDLKLKEREELDKLEKEAVVYSPFWDKYKDSEITDAVLKEKFKKCRILYAKRIRDYHLRLMDLLKELGYFPPKEDRTKLSF